MTTQTAKDGTLWASRCDLCNNSRRVGFGAFRSGEEPECPWCRGVRLKYGNYWYPITDSNRHLFFPPPVAHHPV